MQNFDSLREKLNVYHDWPLNYMFKFIVPAQIEKIAMVEALFDGDTTIYHKESSTGKFVSITAKCLMNNPDQIIAVYAKAASIENIMAL